MTFPRANHNVAGVIERSLHLSCPEAARLLLRDPREAAFDEVERSDKYPVPTTFSDAPHPYFWEIRSTLLSLLQNRRYPISKRLLLVGHICDKLSELATAETNFLTPQTLQAFSTGIDLAPMR